MSIGRIVIAGTNSGCGKTTITTAVLAALKKRNKIVQPFKAGPDYIDPMFHTTVTGRKGRNLDSWLLNENTLRYLFEKNSEGAEIAVIEGVMGLYDGIGTSFEGSTAQIASILKAPVILVLSVKGMSLSIAAMIKGYCEFNKAVFVAGVILNHVKSQAHYILLKESIEANTKVEVLGYFSDKADYILQSRHLGLVTAIEYEKLSFMIEALAIEAQKHIDIDRLIQIANMIKPLYCKTILPQTKKNQYSDILIGIPKDKAFCFYYEDNLELLEYMGAKLIYFDTMKDTKLPQNITGLYIGGGYPELYGQQLENNKSLRQEIKKRIEEDLPVYAECGGLMYLFEKIVLQNGQCYEMVGAFDGFCSMESKLQHFGYVDMEFEFDCCIGTKGTQLRGHEFHYSKETIYPSNPCCFTIKKERKGKSTIQWKSGYCKRQLTASYPHIHFWSNFSVPIQFLESCKNFKQRKEL